MERFIFRLCVVTGLLCLCVFAKAQSYTFSKFSAPYTDLSGANVVPFSAFSNTGNLYWLDELSGSTYYYYGQRFVLDTVSKVMYIQSRGNLRIDNDSQMVIIDGAFGYLDSLDLQSSVSYKQGSVNGETVFIAQWKNMHWRNGQSGNYLNFQIWVYQKSGLVELRYGPSSASNASGYTASNGPMAGMFFTRSDFTKCYEKLWITGSTSNYKLDSNANYSFSGMWGVPPLGTVYRFTPRFLTNVQSHPKKKAIFMYPNPVKNELYFNENGNYEVHDITGGLLLRKYDVKQLDVSTLAPGIYFITDSAGRRAKIVKE